MLTTQGDASSAMQIAVLAALCIGAAFAGLPVLWMLSSSFKTNPEIFESRRGSSPRASRSTPTRRSSTDPVEAAVLHQRLHRRAVGHGADIVRRDSRGLCIQPVRVLRSSGRSTWSSSRSRRCRRSHCSSRTSGCGRARLYNTYPGLILTYMVFTLPYAIIMMTGVLQHPAPGTRRGRQGGRRRRR